MKTAKEFTLWGRNRPGNLARITRALSNAGVNITAFVASEARGRSPVRLIVDNGAKARAALKNLGIKFTQASVLVLNLADKPGALARAAEKLAASGVNIDYGYATAPPSGNRATIVLAVSNPAKARRALG